jgi:hypothetical protein
MSSLSNINNNSSVINVGRTTPVSPGQQDAANSIPVVLASDQTPIPVVEQNKIQSEVALSLLGIPRSEVALGIFADVNTYDVNPSEWSSEPANYTPGYGIKHLPDEAGALVQAPKDSVAILTSKRFFRYQPGRVSAATFGVKSTVAPADVSGQKDLNPAIRKYGIFDKFDGYYWETMKDSTGDRFSVVRRTQSLLKYIPVPFSGDSAVSPKQQQDYGQSGKAPSTNVTEPNALPVATTLLTNTRFTLAAAAVAALTGADLTYYNVQSADDKNKCLRDLDLALDTYILDLQYGGNAHTIANATTYETAVLSVGAASCELALHTQFSIAIVAALTAAGEAVAAGRIPALSTIMKNIFNGTGGPTQLQVDNANYGTRSKLSTVFAIYTRYLGYLGSKWTQDGSGNITSANYVASASKTAQEIEYRCFRDVRYVVAGYGRDLEFGGNAGTVYNAKNYYFTAGGEPLIQVYSQTGIQSEAYRHSLLKRLIASSSTITLGTKTIPSVFTRFGLTAYKTSSDLLCDLIISNFTSEYLGNADFGTAPQYGNLIILRDNLIMTHAAVHDPSLLKPKRQVVVRVNSDGTIEAAEDEYIVGQYVNFVGPGTIVNLVLNKMYKVITVRGTKGNILSLGDPLNGDAPVLAGTASGVCCIEPNVPFIFPNDYYSISDPAVPGTPFYRTDGAFPYMYVNSDSALPAGAVPTVGFIDTANLLGSADNIKLLKSQIDNLNLRYNNWIKQNVDPKYYAVYEYRIPRSRFSTDQLNGQTNKVVYSDLATSSVGGRVYPGQNVVTAAGAQAVNTSVWDLDFTKVTMLKIEFSWYGAVGALFLAYVPVSNGEARWVRVHHLRASNQLKISSLGNATLPITYLCYGGGSVNRMGVADQSDKGYGSVSNHIVKYGASYYIDGGDRGTVRLYSYSTDNPVDIYGSKYALGTLSLTTDGVGTYIDVTGITGLPSDLTFFMNAKLITSNKADQNVEVQWISGTKLYLNKSTLISTSGLGLISNRPSVVFGLKAKENILNQTGTGVRNRVQVYPTKLSTSNIGATPTPVKMKILKTPYFQPPITTNGSFTLSSNYIISSTNTALSSASTGYLSTDGDYAYGWFRATIGPDVGTVFGKLYKQSGLYYFTLLQTFSVTVTLLTTSPFLKEGRFDILGNTLTTVAESTITKERLSSVYVSTEIQAPVPKSGTEVASFFLKPGSDQFDLLSYFDYNKDYLSYPLTNQIDSLYLVSDSSQNNTSTAVASISASLTWEEQ